MDVKGMLAILIGAAIGYAILYWKKKKDAERNASYQSQQFTQFQNQTPQGQQSEMFCFNCGKQIEVGASFWPFCGAAQNAQQAGMQ